MVKKLEQLLRVLGAAMYVAFMGFMFGRYYAATRQINKSKAEIFSLIFGDRDEKESQPSEKRKA